MKILIVYYSKWKATEKLAYFLKDILEKKGNQIEIQKIEPQKERSFWEWFFLRIFKRETPIKKPKILNLKKYDRVLIGTPNWTRLSLPIARFLKEAKGLERKLVGFFSTTHLPPIIEWWLFSGFLLEKTIQNALHQKKARLLSFLFLKRGNFDQKKIEKFIKEISTTLVSTKKLFQEEKKSLLRTAIFFLFFFIVILLVFSFFFEIPFFWIEYWVLIYLLMVLSYLSEIPTLGEYFFATSWPLFFFYLFYFYKNFFFSSYILYFFVIFLSLLLLFRNPFLVVYTLFLLFFFSFFNQKILNFEQKIFLLGEGAILVFLAFILRNYSLSFWKFYELEEEEKTILEIRLRARTKSLREERERLKEEVKRRTQKLLETSKKLKERVKELEKFYKLTIGRELKIKELKRKIKKLEEKLKKYES